MLFPKIKNSAVFVSENFFLKLPFLPDTKKCVPRHWKTGLVSRGVSLTSWGDAFLALTSHPSSNGITKEIPCGVMLYYTDQHCTSSFTIGFLKTKSNFIVRPVETGLGRWTMGVALNSVDAYPFLAFSDHCCHLEDTRGLFWLHCATW